VWSHGRSYAGAPTAIWPNSDVVTRTPWTLAGHIEQMPAYGMEPMVARHALVGLESRQPSRPARGPSTMDSATIRLRAGVGRGYRQTAELLGNTPTVTRKSYVDAHVVDLYRQGVLIDVPRAVQDLASAFADRTAWEGVERSVLRLLV
jgi:hypothetical protein